MFRAFLILLGLLAGTTKAAEVTRLKADEQIVLYPTIGQCAPDRQAWRLAVRGCVFEPAKGRVTLALLREVLELKDIELSAEEDAIFAARARLFLVDHERGKRVFVRVGDKVFPVGRSGADGKFAGEVLVAEREVRALRQLRGDGSWLPVAVALAPGDARSFAGEVLLLEDTGVSVISDIDDTIKVTEVRDRRALLRNTFLRAFQPVPGMAEFYQKLARSNGVAFHYVSASPWQLYPPLAAFLRAGGFPAGTFHLKPFRWKDRSFLSLFSNPERYKLRVIEPLLKPFPKRRFIFVGDSGERDPEIYAALARKFPAQVEHIYIRDVTGESAAAARYRDTFRGLPPGLWTVFRDPPNAFP